MKGIGVLNGINRINGIDGLKSLFITCYIVFIVAVNLFALGALVRTGEFVSWVGVLLVTVPFVVVMGRFMTNIDVARNNRHLPLITGLGFLGLVLTMASYVRGGSGLAPPLAMLAWVGLLFYDYWYSRFDRESSPLLTPGKKLSEFFLQNLQGDAISSSFLTDKPTIWLFYRGNWCPLCMAQIKELVQQYRELESLGVRVALISPQPHGNTVSLAKKFGLIFDFFTDEDNKAAKKLGIEHAAGLPKGLEKLGYDEDTVWPTVIITGAGGKILWVDETDNYRVRPDPDVFLPVLREKGLAPNIS